MSDLLRLTFSLDLLSTCLSNQRTPCEHMVGSFLSWTRSLVSAIFSACQTALHPRPVSGAWTEVLKMSIICHRSMEQND